MAFVDGSNLLAELSANLGVTIRTEAPQDHELSLACQVVNKSIQDYPEGAVGPFRVLRRYWFGAIQGSPEHLLGKEKVLRDAGYEAVLFPKIKGGREKGVDLAVAREMLIHGFNKNYQIAVLVAGDEDYLGLVQDLKRLGLLVVGLFFDSAALSPRLRNAFDAFQVLKDPVAVNPALTNQIRGVNAV